MSVCTVCEHADLEAINELLAAKVPVREIGRRYGIAKSNVARHRSTCTMRTRVRERARAEVALVPRLGLVKDSSRDLADELAALKNALVIEMRRAELEGKGIPLNVARELRATLEVAIKTALALEGRDGDRGARVLRVVLDDTAPAEVREIPREPVPEVARVADPEEPEAVPEEPVPVAVKPALEQAETPAPELPAIEFNSEGISTVERVTLPGFNAWARQSLLQAEEDDGD